MFFVHLFDLCLFGFVGFLLGSGKGYGLWLWHSLDFSLTFFFSWLQPLWHSWIPNRNISSYLWSARHTNTSYQVSSNSPFWFRRSSKEFQKGGHGGHLGFPAVIILSFFDLQVPKYLLQGSESVGLSVQVQNSFSNFSSGVLFVHWKETCLALLVEKSHLGFSIGTILAIFFNKTPKYFFYQVFSQLAFKFRGRSSS